MWQNSLLSAVDMQTTPSHIVKYCAQYATKCKEFSFGGKTKFIDTFPNASASKVLATLDIGKIIFCYQRSNLIKWQ